MCVENEILSAQFPIHMEKIALLMPSFSLILLQVHEMEGLTQFFLYQRHFFVNNAIISLIGSAP
jgi:hypothetical protein